MGFAALFGNVTLQDINYEALRINHCQAALNNIEIERPVLCDISSMTRFDFRYSNVVFSTGLFENIATESVKNWLDTAAEAGVRDIITKETVTSTAEEEDYYDRAVFLQVRSEPRLLLLLENNTKYKVQKSFRPKPSMHLPGKHFLFIHLTLKDSNDDDVEPPISKRQKKID